MTDTERPSAYVFDMERRELTITPLSDEEWGVQNRAQTAQARVQFDQAEKARMLQNADLALVREKAHDDPAFAALARLLGVDVPAEGASS
jgi:hypothetical protein